MDVSFVDVEVDAHEPPVETTLPNWREKMRNDILGASEETEASDEESIEEFEELKTPEVSLVKGALELSKSCWISLTGKETKNCPKPSHA